MPTQREIDRTIILFHRTPDDPHDFVDYFRPVGWLERLPEAGLVEFADLMNTVRNEVLDEVDRRKK